MGIYTIKSNKNFNSIFQGIYKKKKNDCSPPKKFGSSSTKTNSEPRRKEYKEFERKRKERRKERRLKGRGIREE